MKFKYVGPHDAVELVGRGEVKHGATVEATGAAAESLQAQADTWQRVDAPKKTPAKSATESEE